ncbi:MAG: hypothetical protein Q7S95_01075 [bacterium]|nr:hypothetical protein [bacterium]
MMDSCTKALAHFKRHDPRLYEATKAHHRALPPTLPAKRSADALFSALVSIVISQQLGTKAADSIFARVKRACMGKLTPASVLATPEKVLREAGLSGAKIKTIKSLAHAVKTKEISLISLKRDTVDNSFRVLTSLWGLGPWSVEMFLMFALGHSDVFSTGDLGLIRSIERIYGIKEPTRTSLLSLSEKWSPYRTWACLLLWRSRDGFDRAQSEEVLRRARRRAPPPTTKGRHR